MQKHSYLLIAGALLALACTQGGGGKMFATGTGNLSNALEERVSPTADFQRRCGTGQLTSLGAQTLDRAPYLQQVSATSALVLFTSSGEGEVHTLTLTRPSGRVVKTVQAVPDASDPSGLQWVARLTELEPDTVYCHALDGLSERAGFRTAPLAFKNAVVRFVVFGDSGSGSQLQDAVRNQLNTVRFDLMLHTGDIVYGGGTVALYDSNFFDKYAGLLGSVPAFPISGNHDYETAAAGSYRQVFALPENGGSAGLERWYSFDWGDVHFVALDTEQLGEPQTAWLAQDLAQNELPWTIVYLHRPPFSSGHHGSSRQVREAFSSLFEQHGVQVVFAGHEHSYERTRLINGVTYVVTGGGGYGTRSVGRSAFTAYSEGVLHFVHAELQGDALLLHAIDAGGREFDSASIARDPDLTSE
jgi:predicted phosphodiesterase